MSKTFQNWLKATLSISTPIETIESHPERKNNNMRQNQNIFTTTGYWEKSAPRITQPGVPD